ncbi:MAG: molybdate ABC transporter substrate-binding protein [gamma proteobacterium symbiont of Taylorina sp.]|nr:molybdate ABC transporter substrate-binding protein [gamma proteobacterium symbiont of Taylorina sp.]
MKKGNKKFLIHLTSLFLLVSSAVQANEIKLALANSTCNVFKKVGILFSQNHDVTIEYICKSSGRLAKGLRGQAIVADIYVSANESWMNYAVKEGLVEQDKVTIPWGNTLIVAMPKSKSVKLDSLEDLKSEKIKTIMIGDPGTAPFGRYAKQSLKKANIWDDVKERIITKKHITLLSDTLATSDNGTVGLLFETNLNENLHVIHKIQPSLHEPIYYFMAPLKNQANKNNVNQFLQFLRTSRVKDLFLNAGFKLHKQE